MTNCSPGLAVNFALTSMALSSIARTPCDLSGWRMWGPISGSAASSWPIRLMIFLTFVMSVS